MKKNIIITTFIFLLSASLLNAFAREGKVLVYGGIGEEAHIKMKVAPYVPSKEKVETKNKYLISFDGFGEEKLDGRVILFEKRKKKKKNYIYAQLGVDRMSVRSEGRASLLRGTVVPYLSVHHKVGKWKVYFIGFEKLNVQKEINEKYLQDQGLELSLVKSKKKIKKALSQLNKGCKSDIKLNILWEKFAMKGEKKTPGVLARYLDSLSSICKKDDEYKMAVQKVSRIEVFPSTGTGKHQASLESGVIKLEIDRYTPNIQDASYELLLAIF